MKAPFTMEVIRPSDVHTLSNMPLATVYPKREEHKADVFVTSFPMSTFSAGVFISDFVSYGNGTYDLMIVNEIVPVMKHDIMKYAPAVVTNVDTQYRIYQSFNVFSTQKVPLGATEEAAAEREESDGAVGDPARIPHPQREPRVRRKRSDARPEQVCSRSRGAGVEGIHPPFACDISSAQGYMSSLLSANFANISWDGNETSLLSAELESELAFLTCFYGYQPCIDKAMEMFREVKDNTPMGDDMPSHLRYTVFCEAVKNGGEKNWKFLWDRLQEADDFSERADIIKALSCSRSPELLGNYLKSVVQPDDVIRHEDVPSLLTSFSDNLEGRPVAFKFINNEWGSIHKKFRQMPEALLQIEESLIESASESSDVEMLTSFYKRNKKSTMVPEWRYKQAQEERKLDDAWKSKFYPVVKHWLDEIELPAV
ncbi:hypothetical protein V5799_002262 [Amblyomma americanum]|uniref:ERAP1-like C-terminal domain-containing protein n=1 Tax=Amblyomma americanum TaxID=6943 RepID=A0AAQ4CXU6_AMBAM